MSAPAKRGYCMFCCRRYRILKDGTIATHRILPFAPCSGSRRPPGDPERTI